MTRYEEVSWKYGPDGQGGGNCERAKFAEECSNEINRGCIPFWQMYVRQLYVEWREDPPECIESFLKIGSEVETFPMFNNLVEELVKIQKLLNERK